MLETMTMMNVEDGRCSTLWCVLFTFSMTLIENLEILIWICLEWYYPLFTNLRFLDIR